jgi:hypothetical protein
LQTLATNTYPFLEILPSLVKMSFLSNALSTAFALVGLNNSAYHGLALPCREYVNNKKALYSFNTVVTCPVYSTTTMGAVSTACCLLLSVLHMPH